MLEDAPFSHNTFRTDRETTTEYGRLKTLQFTSHVTQRNRSHAGTMARSLETVVIPRKVLVIEDHRRPTYKCLSSKGVVVPERGGTPFRQIFLSRNGAPVNVVYHQGRLHQLIGYTMEQMLHGKSKGVRFLQPLFRKLGGDKFINCSITFVCKLIIFHRAYWNWPT